MLTADRLEDALLCAAMESDVAYEHMESICAAASIPFPPRSLEQQADDYQREQIASANSLQPL